MADQFRWFKLWTSALDDPDLANLSMEDFGRWCAFGAYLKQHGTDGSIVLRPPAVYLCQRLRVADMTAALACISLWPNVQIRRDDGCDDHVTQDVTVTWRNWRKYQRDSSALRMRAKRRRDHSSVTPKRRGDKTRGDETREKQARTSADRCQQMPADVAVSPKNPREAESTEEPEVKLEASTLGEPSRLAPTLIEFRIPPSISEALDRAPRLGADQRIRTPGYWQALVRAHAGVNYGHEVLKAEAWMVSNPAKAPRKNLARFLASWIARAEPLDEEVG